MAVTCNYYYMAVWIVYQLNCWLNQSILVRRPGRTREGSRDAPPRTDSYADDEWDILGFRYWQGRSEGWADCATAQGADEGGAKTA